MASLSLIAQLLALAFALSAIFDHAPTFEYVQALSLTKALATAAAALLCRVLFQNLADHYAAIAGQRACQQARLQLTEHWRTQLVQRAGKQSPEQAGLLLEPVESLFGYIARYLPQRTQAVLVPAVILVIVFSLNWVAGVFLLISAPLIPLFMTLVGMGAARLNQQHMDTLQRLSALFIDRLRNLSLLYISGREAAATAHVSRAADHYRRINMKTLRVAFLSSAVLEFFAAVAIAALAIYIGFSLLGYIDWGPSQNLSLFSGLLILMLAPEFFQPLRNFAQYYHDRAAALGAATQLMVEGTVEPSTSKSPGSLPKLFLRRKKPASEQVTLLHWQGGLYRYQPQEAAIFIPAFTLKKGACMVIFGPSGGGKSTLLRLLSHGSDAASFDENQPFLKIPNKIALQRQNPWLFAGSVMDNLKLYNATVSRAEVEQVLSDVGLTGFADVSIVEQGRNISGGEAKRIALARCLLAPITEFVLVLDEPFAGLDDTTTARVIERLRWQHEQGQTIVIAAHEHSHARLRALATTYLEVGEASAAR
nr:ATP-binding cassette domain-containing protein [Aliidiomarina indica]